MKLRVTNFYVLIISLCLVGYAWLVYKILYPNFSNFSGCLIKYTTTSPCPSCGTTRSLTAILHGNIQQALFINPLGIIVFLLMLLLPIWSIIDLVRNKRSLYHYFLIFENSIKQKRIAIPLVLLLVINWLWNIYKQL